MGGGRSSGGTRRRRRRRGDRRYSGPRWRRSPAADHPPSLSAQIRSPDIIMYARARLHTHTHARTRSRARAESVCARDDDCAANGWWLPIYVYTRAFYIILPISLYYYILYTCVCVCCVVGTYDVYVYVDVYDVVYRSLQYLIILLYIVCVC